MLTHRKSKYRGGGVNYFRLGEGMTIENRSDLGRLKTLSIWGMYVLTPKTAQRRGLYCKPTPPVRLTTSSRGDRVPTHPPNGDRPRTVSHCVLHIHSLYMHCMFIQLHRARSYPLFQVPTAVQRCTPLCRSQTALE